MEHAFFILDS